MNKIELKKNYTIKFNKNINKSMTDVNILKFLEETGNNIEDFHIVSGIASTDSIDTDRERIELSAWDETIKEKGCEYPAFYNHDIWTYPIGKVFITSISNGALNVTFLLPKDDTEISGKIYPQLKCRTIKSMSIGGYATDYEDDKDLNVRSIKSIILREISLVVFPANEDAEIQSIKGVTSFHKYKIADSDTDWQKTEAIKRFREFSGSKEKPSSTYKNGFLWYDKTNQNNFTAYKFPFVDIIDGEVKIVPKAIFSAKAYINRAYNEPNISEDDIIKLKDIIKKYYKLMGLEEPEFKKYETIEDYYTENLKTITDVSDELKYKGFSNKEANIFISKLKTILEPKINNRNDNNVGIDSNCQKSEIEVKAEIIKGLLDIIKK